MERNARISGGEEVELKKFPESKSGLPLGVVADEVEVDEEDVEVDVSVCKAISVDRSLMG
jgi:hypothetical protein